MADNKFLSKLSVNGSEYIIKDTTARGDIALISGLAFNGAESLSGQIADLKAHGADSALSGVNYVQTQLNSLSGTALNGAESLSGTIAALDAQEKADVTSLSGSIETLKTKEQNDVNSLSGSIVALSGALVSAIEGLDAEVTSTDGTFVNVKVTEVDGKITAVNVTENDIASASGLTKETADRTAADTALATAITGSFNTLSGMVANLDYADPSATAGQVVWKVTQEDGKIAVEHRQVHADEVVVDTTSGIIGANVQDALQNLHEHIDDAEAAGKVSITSTNEGLGDDILKRYTFYQGTSQTAETLIGSIDIPKDLVVTGGSVFAATAGTTVTGTTVTEGDLILQLDIANQTNPVLIPVKSLTDIYTGVAGSEIIVEVTGTDISASLVSGSITKDKLATAVKTSLDLADSSIQNVNGKPGNGAGGDVVLDSSDIMRTGDNSTQSVEAALTDIESSVDAIDTRVSGLEAWKASISGVYHTQSEKLDIWWMNGIQEVND